MDPASPQARDAARRNPRGLLGGRTPGGEHRGEETTFLVAMGRAREAVSDDLESRTFRALEAEAARDGRVPASVVSHLARVISDLELELRDCQMKGNP